MVSKIAFILICLTFLSILSGCKTVEEYYIEDGYRELKGEELRQKVTDTIVSTTSSGWIDSYSSDGKMSGTSSRGLGYAGTWEINKNGKLCISSSNNYINGCASVFLRENDGSIEWLEPDGRSYSVTIKPIQRGR